MKILKINSSANKETSISRKYVEAIISKIKSVHTNAEIINRDVAYDNLPYLNDTMVASYFAQGERSADQEKAIEVSNTLVAELQSADAIVIGCPIYNFTIPAPLKSYIDLISRAGLTFRYTEQGIPEGLLNNKKVYVAIPSGGVAVGSEADLCSPYLTTIFGFLGITDITFIPIDQLMMGAEEKMKKADALVASLNV